MGTYSVTFESEHGTHSIHDGLTFDEVVDVVDEVTFETRGLRVEVTNKGKTPAEFESLPLGLELVVAPGSTRSRVLPGKSPGTYPFYDEFHMQTTQGVFVIK